MTILHPRVWSILTTALLASTASCAIDSSGQAVEFDTGTFPDTQIDVVDGTVDSGLDTGVNADSADSAPADTTTTDTGMAETSSDSTASETATDSTADTIVDTATTDTIVDSGTADTGILDTGTPDTGSLDTGTLDIGTLDFGTVDTGKLDTGTLDSGGDSATTDVADTADTSCAVYLDGTYDWGIWTCSAGSRTTDIKAFAISIGIASVDETIVGTNGTVNSNYSGAPPCSRTTQFVNTYPTCGVVTTTTASTFTCSASCAAAKCTAGSQTVTVSTYSITTVDKTVTTKRVLDAAFFADISLQKVAGCQIGDTETATLIRR